VPLEMMLRAWARPPSSCTGSRRLHGPGVKTAVPKEAELKWSFRLVNGQDRGASRRGFATSWRR